MVFKSNEFKPYIKRLFLDDIRIPVDCINYMHPKIGKEVAEYKYNWAIVRNYEQFVTYILSEGIPDLVSFDHDLAPEHYIDWDRGIVDSAEFVEKTGVDCAQYLKIYCGTNDIPLPKYFIHSMNPVGAANIKHILK